MNLFALLKDDNNNNIVRISLSRDVQNELKEYITPQVSEIAKKEVITFNGQYKPDNDQVLQIENFETHFKNRLTIDCNELKDNQIDKIKSIIFYFEENKIAFQTFDSRKIFQPQKFSLIYSNNTFSRLNSKGININQKIDALFVNGKLLFYSYQNVSKIFSNLSEYYREATDNELNEINESNNIEFEQGLSFEMFNSRMRKKLFLIKENKVFENVEKNYKSVKNHAKNFDLDGCFENGMIIFPSDKKKLEKLINYLNDDLYESPISNEKYETNSKRKIHL